ncbi:MAG: hydrolase [Oscillospiraceae bacterium]|nr:hydrolase [Oscillospiraceae bacterium]
MSVVNPYGKRKCQCCGFYTMKGIGNGNFERCPVCFWEDDPIQSANPNYSEGSNCIALTKARINFLKYGAIKQELADKTRKPNDDEKSF